MPRIPSNFVPRREIQSLVTRASELASQPAVEPELAALLGDLAVKAAGVEGYLSQLAGEVADSGHPNHKALANPDGWSSGWHETPCRLHTRRGVFFISLGRQVVVSPSGSVFPTERMRVVLGEGEDAVSRVSTDAEGLRGLAEEYLRSFEDVVPEGVREAALGRFFRD